jgi:Ricin-type beta-trefoil lectin domain-like
MAKLRRLIGVTLAGMVAAAATLAGSSGAAYATITNPPGYEHVKVSESGKCLMADADTGAVEVWRCLNTASEEWHKIPVWLNGEPFPTHFMLESHWTSLCMAAASQPANGVKVVQAPCDIGDTRQYWQRVYLDVNPTNTDNPAYHIVTLNNGLCLDKPDGKESDGVQLQVWGCGGTNPHWNPIFDYHYEQWWYFS